jgi:hypothetical protein
MIEMQRRPRRRVIRIGNTQGFLIIGAGLLLVSVVVAWLG